MDEDHGNPLAVWQQMGSPVFINRAEEERIRSESEVVEESWPYAVEDGTVRLECALGVNDVYFFTLKNAVGGKL